MRLDSQENIAAMNAEVSLARLRFDAAAKLADLESKEALAALDSQITLAQSNIERLREPNQTAEEEPVAVS